MNLKHLLTKALLVVAMLGGGTGAWGEDYEFTQVASYNFEGETPTNPFTDNSGVTGRCSASTYSNEATSSTALKFTGSNLSGKTYGYHVYDFSSSTKSSTAVKVVFDFKIANQNHTHFSIRDASVASETNKSSYTGTGVIFRFGNSRVSGSNKFGYNGNAVTGASYDTWYHIEVIVDVVNKKVSYTLKSLDQTTTIDSQSNLDFLTSTPTACTQLDFFGIANADMASIDNIVVSEYTSASATTYSVEKYDKSGNLLSLSTGNAGVAGETSSVSDADKNTFYSADTNSKYVYDNTDERNVTSMELTSNAATNVLKLYFDTYTKCTATVQSVCGTNSIDDITGTFYSDETKTLYWPKVVSCSDGYYVVDANVSEPHYGYTFSSSDLTKSVTYTLDESIVYYNEYENLCSAMYSADYFTGISSNGRSRALTGTGIMTTTMNLESAGVFDIVIAGGNRDGGHTTTMEMKLKDSEGNISENNVISQFFTGSEWIDEITANKVSIPAGSELYVANDNGTGNGKFAGDYIIVRKSYSSATIGTTGWTTFANPYALDLSDMTASSGSVTAYYASAVADNKVTMTSTDATVPAGEGIMLKGTAGATITIPVAVSGTSISGNKLVGVTSETTITSETTNYANFYVLSNNSGKAEFQNLKDYIDAGNSVTINAGKAYLDATTASGSRLSIVFDDDVPTGIADMEEVRDVENDNVYTLSGQRISKPTKGMFIMNGKKVIMK